MGPAEAWWNDTGSLFLSTYVLSVRSSWTSDSPLPEACSAISRTGLSGKLEVERSLGGSSRTSECFFLGFPSRAAPLNRDSSFTAQRTDLDKSPIHTLDPPPPHKHIPPPQKEPQV